MSHGGRPVIAEVRDVLQFLGDSQRVIVDYGDALACPLAQIPNRALDVPAVPGEVLGGYVVRPVVVVRRLLHEPVHVVVEGTDVRRVLRVGRDVTLFREVSPDDGAVVEFGFPPALPAFVLE